MLNAHVPLNARAARCLSAIAECLVWLAVYIVAG